MQDESSAETRSQFFSVTPFSTTTTLLHQHAVVDERVDAPDRAVGRFQSTTTTVRSPAEKGARGSRSHRLTRTIY